MVQFDNVKLDIQDLKVLDILKEITDQVIIEDGIVYKKTNIGGENG